MTGRDRASDQPRRNTLSTKAERRENARNPVDVEVVSSAESTSSDRDDLWPALNAVLASASPEGARLHALGPLEAFRREQLGALRPRWTGGRGANGRVRDAVREAASQPNPGDAATARSFS